MVVQPPLEPFEPGAPTPPAEPIVPPPPSAVGPDGFHPDIEAVLISAGDLNRRVSELAGEVLGHYAGRDLVLVGVLKGAIMFMTDLARQLPIPLEMDFMAVSSYGNATRSSGIVRIT